MFLQKHAMVSGVGGRRRTRREYLKGFYGNSPASQDQNLVLAASYVPIFLDTGGVRLIRCNRMKADARPLGWGIHCR